MDAPPRNARVSALERILGGGACCRRRAGPTASSAKAATAAQVVDSVPVGSCGAGSSEAGEGFSESTADIDDAAVARAATEIAALVTPAREGDPLLSRPAKVGDHLLLGRLEDGAALAEGDWGDDLPAVAGVVNVMPCQGFLGKVYGKLEPPVAFLNVETEDEEGYPILDELPAVVDFVRRNATPERRVLIHCREGRNRAATFAVAYLVFAERRHLGEAVTEVFGKRPFVLQNTSFRLALCRLAAREDLL